MLCDAWAMRHCHTASEHRRWRRRQRLSASCLSGSGPVFHALHIDMHSVQSPRQGQARSAPLSFAYKYNRPCGRASQMEGIYRRHSRFGARHCRGCCGHACLVGRVRWIYITTQHEFCFFAVCRVSPGTGQCGGHSHGMAGGEGEAVSGEGITRAEEEEDVRRRAVSGRRKGRGKRYVPCRTSKYTKQKHRNEISLLAWPSGRGAPWTARRARSSDPQGRSASPRGPERTRSSCAGYVGCQPQSNSPAAPKGARTKTIFVSSSSCWTRIIASAWRGSWYFWR
jgi:hypothetical protein